MAKLLLTVIFVLFMLLPLLVAVWGARILYLPIALIRTPALLREIEKIGDEA